VKLSYDAERRADDLSAEMVRAIARELVEDPTNPSHTYIVLRALARCLGPTLADANRKVAWFWSEELRRELRRAQRSGVSVKSGQRIDNRGARAPRQLANGKAGA
jgi:hypothetical protein